MNARRRDILSILTYLFFSLVVLIVVLRFVFGFQYVVILTDSMEPPHINPPNDLVITKPVSRDDIRLGTSFYSASRLGTPRTASSTGSLR